eukprot:comp24348_c5_seq2/m.46493 comp24348_c5_seq2/g.46493  ORF comp24348_c5_seq2/g.46493 comp24348_c5_seq2/m.46493 type:complete len:389 (-) comp24348_c5_seq2:2983-4149(-)
MHRISYGWAKSCRNDVYTTCYVYTYEWCTGSYGNVYDVFMGVVMSPRPSHMYITTPLRRNTITTMPKLSVDTVLAELALVKKQLNELLPLKNMIEKLQTENTQLKLTIDSLTAQLNISGSQNPKTHEQTSRDGDISTPTQNNTGPEAQLPAEFLEYANSRKTPELRQIAKETYASILAGNEYRRNSPPKPPAKGNTQANGNINIPPKYERVYFKVKHGRRPHRAMWSIFKALGFRCSRILCLSFIGYDVLEVAVRGDYNRAFIRDATKGCGSFFTHLPSYDPCAPENIQKADKERKVSAKNACATRCRVRISKAKEFLAKLENDATSVIDTDTKEPMFSGEKLLERKRRCEMEIELFCELFALAEGRAYDPVSDKWEPTPQVSDQTDA